MTASTPPEIPTRADDLRGDLKPQPSGPVIEISGSGQRFRQAIGETLLHAALRAGIGFPYECSVGSCGTCKFNLLEGTMKTHWTNAPGLSAKDRARGRSLACQSAAQDDCLIKVRTESQFVPPITPRRRVGMLARITMVSHDIREFCIKTEEAADFLPGQYMLWILDDVAGPRAYSLSNLANDAGEWHFQIRRAAPSPTTTAVFDRLTVGSALTMDGPYGLAYLRHEEPRDLLCIAGGSGLAPMLSITRGAAHHPRMAARRIEFFYGGRRPRDICCEAFLRELPGFDERIFFYPVVSHADDEDAWEGRRGFVHDAVAEHLGSVGSEFEFYLAGPPSMIEACLKVLMLDYGVPAARVHYDRFS